MLFQKESSPSVPRHRSGFKQFKQSEIGKTTEAKQILSMIPLTLNRPTVQKTAHRKEDKGLGCFYPVPKFIFGNRHCETVRTNAALKQKLFPPWSC